jgi:hypothetical protein
MVPQGLWNFSVDLADLPCVLSLLCVAFSCLVSTDNEVDLPVGILKHAIGVAYFRWQWRSWLLSMVAIIVVLLGSKRTTVSTILRRMTLSQNFLPLFCWYTSSHHSIIPKFKEVR